MFARDSAFLYNSLSESIQELWVCHLHAIIFNYHEILFKVLNNKLKLTFLLNFALKVIYQFGVHFLEDSDLNGPNDESKNEQ